jgi:hypothetical protein
MQIKSLHTIIYSKSLFIIVVIILSGVRLGSFGTAATYFGLLYQPQMIDDGDCGAVGGMKICGGKQKYSEKTYTSATSPTTNST